MGLEETQTGATTPTAHELARDPAAFEPPPALPAAPVTEANNTPPTQGEPAPVVQSPPGPAVATPAAAPGVARRPGRPPRAARAGEDPAKLELKRLKDRVRKAKTPEAAKAALSDYYAAQGESDPESEADEPGAAVTPAPPAETTAPAAPEPPKPAEPAKIMGADAETVALIGPHALQAWGKLADKAQGTRYEFRGDREMTFFPGTPFEQVVKANPERDLAQLTAVVIAKHLPKAINAATQPEVMLAGVALMTFGLPAVGHAVEAVREWWRGRAARAETTAEGQA